MFRRRNVALLVDSPRVKRQELKTLSPDQAREFLKAVRSNRLEGLYAVAMLGLRQGEIFGLQWSDIDVESGAIMIRRALQRVRIQRNKSPDLGLPHSKLEVIE